MGNNYLEVQSLQRTFDILEVIGSSSSPVSIKTITETTGLAKSTVYRLLNNLESRDYIHCNSDGSYQLGLKLLMLSQRSNQEFDLKNLVKPFLIQLNEITGETIFMGIMQKNKVLYVDMVESIYPVRMVSKIGSINDLHSTSLGKALLMGHTNLEIRKILSKTGMVKKTEYTITSPEEYLKEIEICRQQGYTVDNREGEMECRCVGAPIHDHTGRIIAAISISGIISRFTLDTIHGMAKDELLRVIGEIEHTLGRMIK